GRQRDVKAGLRALDPLPLLHHREGVPQLEALALAAREVQMASFDLEDVGAPGAVLQLRDERVLHVRNRRADGTVIERLIVISAAAEPGDLAGLRGRVPGTAGGEEDVAGAHVDQADLNFRMGVLDLGAAEKAALAGG